MREGWIQKRFDEVFDLQMGKTPDRKNFDFFEGDNVWVSIRDLTSKEISDSNEHISDAAVKSSNIKKVSKGTVIMSFKLTVGKCAVAAKDLYTNEAIMAFNLKEGYNIDSSFLYYYLQSYKWEGANKAVMGITLNKATISRHNISIPPKSQQEAIVSELDEINSLLALKREQLQKYDKLAQSLFYEMFGDPVENEKGWEVKTLGEIAYIGLGFTHTPKYVDNGVAFLSVKDVSSGRIIWDNIHYVSEEEYLSAPKGAKPNKGDILFCRVGTMGKPLIIDTDIPFCTFVSLGYLHLLSNEIINVYVKYWMQSDAFDIQVAANVKGLAIKNLNTGWLKNFIIQVPPLSLQQQFASRIEQIELQKTQVQAAIENLETLLASRMQYWFD